MLDVIVLLHVYHEDMRCTCRMSEETRLSGKGRGINLSTDSITQIKLSKNHQYSLMWILSDQVLYIPFVIIVYFSV